MLSVRGGFPWARTASDANGPFWALATGGKRTNKLAASVSAMARSKKRKRSERCIDGSPLIGRRAPLTPGWHPELWVVAHHCAKVLQAFISPVLNPFWNQSIRCCEVP